MVIAEKSGQAAMLLKLRKKLTRAVAIGRRMGLGLPRSLSLTEANSPPLLCRHTKGSCA